MKYLRFVLKKLYGTLSQLKATTCDLVHKLRQRILSFLTWVDEVLYQKDITRRRFHRATRLGLLLAYSGVLILIGVLFSPYAWVVLIAFVHAVVPSIVGFGVWLNLSNPSEFATILIAEVIAIFGSSIIARIFSREPKRIEPRLELTPLFPSIRDDGVRSYNVTVGNGGNTGAIGCEAILWFTEIESRDVLDVDGAMFTQKNFTEFDGTKLLWTNGEKEITLRAGVEDDLESLRLVPERNGIEAHFEVPSFDPTYKSTICLRLKTFYVKLQVSPVNGRNIIRSFTLSKSSLGQWVLS